MSVKEDVKYLLAKEAMTMTQLAEKMKEKTGYSYNLKVISDKLARKTLKYEEFKVIVDILGYDIDYKKRGWTIFNLLHTLSLKYLHTT